MPEFLFRLLKPSTWYNQNKVDEDKINDLYLECLDMIGQ